MTDILKAIKKGFQLTWQYKSMILLLYLFTFLLAALVAYPFKTLLENTVGHSMMVDDLIKGFNYTFLNDFKNAYGASLLPILNQSIIVVLLFLLLFIFWTGGIISTYIQAPPTYDRSIFWGQSANYFWRIFRLTFYFFLIHLVVLAVFLFIFYKSSNGLSPFRLENESTISFNFKIIFPCYILVAAFFFMWQDYCKVELIQQQHRWVFQSLSGSFKFIRQHFFKSYFLYLLNLSFWVFLVWINYWITTSFEIDSSNTIWLSFLISQLFVLGRLGLKLLNLGSVVGMRNNPN